MNDVELSESTRLSIDVPNDVSISKQNDILSNDGNIYRSSSIDNSSSSSNNNRKYILKMKDNNTFHASSVMKNNKQKRKTIRKASQVVYSKSETGDVIPAEVPATQYAEFRAQKPKFRWSSHDTILSRCVSENFANLIIRLFKIPYVIFVFYCIGCILLTASLFVSGKTAYIMGAVGSISCIVIVPDALLLNAAVIRRIFVTSFEAWYMIVITFAHCFMMFHLLPLDIRVIVISPLSFINIFTAYCRDATIAAHKAEVHLKRNILMLLAILIHFIYAIGIVYDLIPDLISKPVNAGDISTNTVEIDTHLVFIIIIFSLKIVYKNYRRPGWCVNLQGKVGFVPVQPLERRATMPSNLKKNESSNKRGSISISRNNVSVSTMPTINSDLKIEVFDPNEMKLVPQEYTRVFSFKYTVCSKLFNSYAADILWYTLTHHQLMWLITWVGGIACAWSALIVSDMTNSKILSGISIIGIFYPLMYILNTNATIMREVLGQFQIYYLLFMVFVLTLALMDYFLYDYRVIPVLVQALTIAGLLLGLIHRVRVGLKRIFFVLTLCSIIASLIMCAIISTLGWFPNIKIRQIAYFNLQFNNVEMVVSCIINICLFLCSALFNVMVSPRYFSTIQCKLKMQSVHKIEARRVHAKSNIQSITKKSINNKKVLRTVASENVLY